MTASRVFFSVVVPTCDRLESLADCLRCLAPGTQTLPAEHYEVIVTDDGRKTTAETLIKTRFPWAQWQAGPRRGPAANRNAGAKQARGDWLAFTDDDCLPAAQWLGVLAAAAQSAPKVEILEGQTTSGGRTMGPFETAPVNTTGGCLWSCNLAVRAERFAALGGFDEGFPSAHLEDVDFHLRARRAGVQPLFVPDAAVVHPPRRVGTIRRQVRDHRAYFYLAAKHGFSLRQAGLSVGNYLRSRNAALRSSRSKVEAIRFGWRCAVEAALLFPACVWWSLGAGRKGRSR